MLALEMVNAVKSIMDFISLNIVEYLHDIFQNSSEHFWEIITLVATVCSVIIFGLLLIKFALIDRVNIRNRNLSIRAYIRKGLLTLIAIFVTLSIFSILMAMNKIPIVN
ncbi:MAG: hypothetical protein IJS81_09985 [Selenomonadaceae bacterium]|nr:hypothetical protein [Selenomonadaceae bacterium]MBQ7630524.1 hypothetical protein [Selenomonadaceae bacterium]